MEQNLFLKSALAKRTHPELIALAEESAKSYAHDLLTNGIPDARVINGLRRDLQAAGQTAIESPCCAWLGILLLFACAESMISEDRDFAKGLVERSGALRKSLCEYYALPAEIKREALQVYAFGTTSIILSTHAYGRAVAVKLLKPLYWGFDELRKRTRSYKVTYNNVTSNAPTVHRCSERWIIMDLVRGPTFSEWVHTQDRSDLLSYAAKLNVIVSSLLSILEGMSGHNPPLSHLDINPFNIIIESVTDVGDRVWLLDFGVNYAITDRVGPPGQYAATIAAVEMFVPPEAFRSVLSFDPRADAYSLGMLVAYALVDGDLNKESLGRWLSQLWEQSPAVAQLVEQLIEPDPYNRLLGVDQTGRDIFAFINRKMQEAFRFFVDVEYALLEEVPTWRRLGESLFGFWIGRLSDIKMLGPTVAFSRTAWLPQENYLKSWAAVCLCAHYLILSIFVVVTAIDLSKAYTGVPLWLVNEIAAVPFIDKFGDWYQAQLVLPAKIGDVWGNLPGRLVCVSFSVVAAKYYMSVFSLVSAIRIGGFREKVAECLVRLNAFSFFPPILVALVVQPHWWPFCVFSGIMPTVANNYVIYRLIDRVNASAGAGFYTNTIQRTDEFVIGFGRWWPQMLIYAICCLGVGVLLQMTVLHDELMYAAIVLVINAVQIIDIIIAQMGKPTRAGIKRMLWLDFRLKVRRSFEVVGSHGRF